MDTNAADRLEFVGHQASLGTALLVNSEDSLAIVLYVGSTGPVVTISARLMLPSFEVTQIQRTVAVTNISAGQQVLFPLFEGWLLGLSVNASSDGVASGNVFCAVYLVRGGLLTTQTAVRLCSGFVSSLDGLQWPYGRNVTSVGQPTHPESGSGAAPGAGAEFVDTGNAWELFRFHYVKFRLVTAVAAATRQCYIELSNSFGVLGRFAANATQLASLTRDYYAVVGAAVPAATSTHIYIPLPDVPYGETPSLAIRVDNIQAADQLSAIILCREIVPASNNALPSSP
jgi:hypothetical protein